MKPSEKLKQKLVFMACGERLDAPGDIRDKFDALVSDDALSDAESELRSGEEETGLPCPGSRHYESKSVAAQMLDGSWVGWTYWYGGGKHGEPEAIDWINDAYEVRMVEVQKVVREFSRVE